MSDFIFNYIFDGLSLAIGDVVLITALVSLFLFAIFSILDIDIWYSIIFAGTPMYLLGAYQILTIPFGQAILILISGLIVMFAFYRIFWR